MYNGIITSSVISPVTGNVVFPAQVYQSATVSPKFILLIITFYFLFTRSTFRRRFGRLHSTRKKDNRQNKSVKFGKPKYMPQYMPYLVFTKGPIYIITTLPISLDQDTFFFDSGHFRILYLGIAAGYGRQPPTSLGVKCKATPKHICTITKGSSIEHHNCQETSCPIKIRFSQYLNKLFVSPKILQARTFTRGIPLSNTFYQRLYHQCNVRWSQTPLTSNTF